MFRPSEMGFLSLILHSRLRSLDLSTFYVKDVVDAINLPSLDEWTQNLGIQSQPVATMLSFLKRSGCCLKVLNLDNICHSSDILSTLLQEIPSLERIRLSYNSVYRGKDVMNDVLSRIFDPVPEDCTPGSFLPHLKFIECKMEDKEAPFSWSSIPKFYHNSHRRSLTLKAFTRKIRYTKLPSNSYSLPTKGWNFKSLI
jgi:hypothetical protein